MAEQKYTIDDLVERTGFSRRTIRYYVQEGLIAPPAGRGRGGFYNDSHLDALMRIKAQKEMGLTISAISRVAQPECTVRPSTGIGQIWTRYQVSPGVELHVSQEMQVRRARQLSELLDAAQSIMKEG